MTSLETSTLEQKDIELQRLYRRFIESNIQEKSLKLKTLLGVSGVPMVIDGTKCVLRGICPNYLLSQKWETIENDEENLTVREKYFKGSLNLRKEIFCETSDYKECQIYQELIK
jgi:hypothetical protein